MPLLTSDMASCQWIGISHRKERNMNYLTIAVIIALVMCIVGTIGVWASAYRQDNTNLCIAFSTMAIVGAIFDSLFILLQLH